MSSNAKTAVAMSRRGFRRAGCIRICLSFTCARHAVVGIVTDARRSAPFRGVLSCCPVCLEEHRQTTDNSDSYPDKNPDNRLGVRNEARERQACGFSWNGVIMQQHRVSIGV